MSINLEPPLWLEALLSAFAAPMVVAAILWNPLLKQFGLISGELFTSPSLGGFLVIVAFYASLAAIICVGLGMVVAMMKKMPKQ